MNNMCELIPYKPMKKTFDTTIIAKSWPMKFLMQGKNNLRAYL